MTPEPKRISTDLLSARRWLDGGRNGRPANPALDRVRERDAARIGNELANQLLFDASAAWLRSAQRTEDPDVAAEVGGLLVNAQRPDEALPLLRRSAEAGSPWGMLHYGRLLLALNDDSAEEWITYALEERPRYARILLEDFQLRGMDAMEERWRTIAADLGDQDSLLATARIAGEQDDLERLRDALQRVDDPEAMIDTAAQLDSIEHSEAVELTLMMVAERGHPRGQLELGRWLMRHDRPVEAEPWLQASLELPDAALLLAEALNRQGRRPEAELVLRRAAEAGDAEAAFELAVAMAARGEREATRPWLTRAAHEGLTDAMIALALLADDMQDWMRWMGIAAARGNANAALRLGLFEDAHHHAVEARAWLRHALALGDPDAERALAEIGGSS